MYLQVQGDADETAVWKRYIGEVDGEERVRRAFNAVRLRGRHLPSELSNRLSLLVHRRLNVDCARGVLPGKKTLYLRSFNILYNKAIFARQSTCNDEHCLSKTVSCVAGRTVRSVINGADYSPYLAYWYLCTCTNHDALQTMPTRCDFTELSSNEDGMIRMATFNQKWGYSVNRVLWHKVNNLFEVCNGSPAGYMRLLKTFLTFVATQYYDDIDQIAFKADRVPNTHIVNYYMSAASFKEEVNVDMVGFVVDLTPKQAPSLLDLAIKQTVSSSVCEPRH